MNERVPNAELSTPENMIMLVVSVNSIQFVSLEKMRGKVLTSSKPFLTLGHISSGSQHCVWTK